MNKQKTKKIVLRKRRKRKNKQKDLFVPLMLTLFIGCAIIVYLLFLNTSLQREQHSYEQMLCSSAEVSGNIEYMEKCNE